MLIINMSVSSTKDMPHFLIDSRDRISGDIEEFDVKLDLKPSNTYDSVALIHCGIPRSFYNIDDSNNSIGLSENGVELTTALLRGNYSATTLPGVVETQMNEISAINFPTTPWTYSWLWNSVTFKWEITVTGHAGRPVDLATTYLFFNGHQTHDLFGFEENSNNYYNVGQVLISTNVANFHRTNYVTIKSNIGHNDGNNAPDSQILARIPVKNVAMGELIIFDLIQIEDGSKLIANNKSNVYHFALYDDHGSLLDLNGREWFMSLMLYEYNKLGKLQLQELELLLRQREYDRERRIDEIDPNASITIRGPSVEQVLIEDGLLPDPTDLENLE